MVKELTIGAEYVVGFMFDAAESAVLLLRKTRPSWQYGKLNGIGGRVEDGETPYQAMDRECGEETGIDYVPWKKFCIFSDERGWRVHFFRAVGPIRDAHTTTDETPIVVPVSRLPVNVVTNLLWLIPMALTMTADKAASGYDIREIWTGSEMEDHAASER